MFKFGFSVNSECEETNNKCEDSSNQMWLPCKKITPHKIDITNDNVNIQSISLGSHQIRYICDKDVIKHFKSDTNCEENSVLSAEQNNSDLLPAIYEGGLKVWECSFDLINYINENLDLKDKKVLDLGCGVGLVGTFSAMKGAQTVLFQDYNSEVLEASTMPNVLLNHVNLETCEFYSGDWQSFCDLQTSNLEENAKYDLIFTSETVYNPNNYKKLVNVFRSLLKKNGEIYLAAKYYYFGVGGGIAQFQDQLVKENIFNCDTCWLCPDGVKRAILKITLK